VSSSAFTDAVLTLGSEKSDISQTNSQDFTNPNTLSPSNTSNFPEITIYMLVDSSHLRNKISPVATLLC
jgi:hypothetical protein